MGTTTPNIGLYIPADGETNYGTAFANGMLNLDTHDHSGPPHNGVPLSSAGLAAGSVTADKLNNDVITPGGGLAFDINHAIETDGILNELYNMTGANNAVFVTDGSGDPLLDNVRFKLLTTGLQLKGNNTNTASPAGFIGEIISATVLSGSATPLVTTVVKTVTSISVTAGVWLIYGQVGIVTGAGTTAFLGGVSTVNNGFSDTNYFQLACPTSAVTNAAINACFPQTYLFSTTTTVYLVAEAVFGSGSASAFGVINALRIA